MTAYTLFSQSTNWAIISDAASYTLGLQFSVSQPVTLTGIWFHSATGAGGLPSECAIYNADTATLVAGTDNAAPSWSGAAASGWVRCAYGGTVTLSPGVHYAAVVLGTPGTNWYSGLSGYWTTGAGAAGGSNGPISAPSSAGALHGQAVYNAGGTLTFPVTTTSGYDFGVDVEVTSTAGTIAPPAATPLIIPPHPLFTRTVLEQAWQRAGWQAQGVADLTVRYALTSGGVDTYNVTSPYNGTATYQMRVLNPSAPNPAYPHGFLLMLPVQQNQDTNLYGDPIGTAQALAAHNGYNLTCVAPGYAPLPVGAEGPWYADNPLNQGIWQETFTLLVTAWARQNLAVTGQEQVYLVGFSRSGTGAQNLLFRHPYTYAAMAAWDAPFGMTDYNGTDPVRGSGVGGDPADGYGTSANFTNKYQMTPARLAGYQGTGQYGTNRIWIGTGTAFQADVPWFDGQLTAAGIPHTFTYSNIVEVHAWQTDWVAAGLQAIIPSQEPTVLPQQIARPALTQLLQVAAWRTPAAAPPPPVAAGSGAAAGTSAAPAAATQGAGATAAGAGSVTAAGSVSGPVTAAAAAAGAGAVTARAVQAAGAAAAGRAAGTGVVLPPFTVGFLTAATTRTGGPG